MFSQILTLYLTPVFYIYMETWRKKLSMQSRKAEKKHLPAVKS
ncbi:hypothetical protein [Nostoc sp.]